MKRYTVKGWDNDQITYEDSEGDWVDADIAQDLYDALEVLMQEWDKHDGHLVSHYHSKTRPKIERAKESLAKADKD